MSLSSLSPTHEPLAHRRAALPWLVPPALLLGFLAAFALAFSDRLLPALPVTTAPVVTLRVDASSTIDPDSPVASTATPPRDNPPPSPSSPPLFQASGWIEPAPYTTLVPTLVDGVVEKIFVLEGETVSQGDLLATLDPAMAQLDLQSARDRLATLRAERAAHEASLPPIQAERDAALGQIAAEESLLAELEDTYQRLASIPGGAISQQQLAQAKFQANRQRALVDAARAELPRLDARLEEAAVRLSVFDAQIGEAGTALDRAQLALDRHQIRSPGDGIVLRLHATPGRKRMAAMDDPNSALIVELFSPDQLQARVDVPLAEAAALSIGQPVTLSTDLLPDRTLHGTVARIDGRADIQRNTLQAKVEIVDPDPRLRPEMLVRAKFYAPTQQASSPSRGTPTAPAQEPSRFALFAPADALISPSPTSATAWVVSPDNTAERRQLTLGAEEKDGHRQITAGLLSGERLILPPHDSLRPGARVRPKVP